MQPKSLSSSDHPLLPLRQHHFASSPPLPHSHPSSISHHHPHPLPPQNYGNDYLCSNQVLDFLPMQIETLHNECGHLPKPSAPTPPPHHNHYHLPSTANTSTTCLNNNTNSINNNLTNTNTFSNHNTYNTNLNCSSYCCCCCYCCCCLKLETKQNCVYKFNNTITKLIQCFLIIPNCLFLLFGSILLALGLWLRSERESYFHSVILNNAPFSSVLTSNKFPLILIILATFILVLSFLGCCGACAESVCFLCLYTSLLIVVVVMEICLSVLVFAMREQIQTKFNYTLQNQIIFDYNNTNTNTNYFPLTSSLSPPSSVSPPYPSFTFINLFYGQNEGGLGNQALDHLTYAWDQLQMQMNCCGSVGPQDYIYSLWYNSSVQPKLKVPPSCCILSYQKDHSDWSREFQLCQSEAEIFLVNQHPWRSIPPSHLKTQGCAGKLREFINKNMFLLVIVVFIVVAIQILDFVFACLMLKLFRKKIMEMSWYGDEEME